MRTWLVPDVVVLSLVRRHLDDAVPHIVVVAWFMHRHWSVVCIRVRNFVRVGSRCIIMDVVMDMMVDNWMNIVMGDLMPNNWVVVIMVAVLV